MSSGPIEFMGATEDHSVPATEYGGADGLIQPSKADTLTGAPEAEGGHSIMSDDATGERNSVAARVAGAPLSAREQVTGEADTPDVMFDPETGVQLPADWKQNGLTTKLSDIKPK
jgi:hypothetical protein